MNRFSHTPCHVRPLIVCCFIVISALLLISSSKPWATTQASRRVEMEGEGTARPSLSFSRRKPTPHILSTKSQARNLSFEQLTDSLLLKAVATKRPDPLATVDNPQLTLNKIHVKNPNDPIPGPNDPPISTTWQPGVPITYVISLLNSGAANSHISVADTLPAGFVFIGATCTATAGASCTGSNMAASPFGPFSIPTGGNIEIRITGYFTTGGSKINSAIATAKDDQGNILNVGSANSSIDQLDVSSAQPTVNIAVTKAVNTTSTTFPAHMHYTITVTNTTTTSVYLGGNLRLRDFFSLNPPLALNWTVSPPTCTPSGGAVCPDMPSSVSNNSGTILFPYDAAGAGAANDNGWFPGNGSYKIEFDVDMTKNATCGAAQVLFGNQAVLDKLSSFSDSIPSDDASQQVNTTIATGLSPCPPTGPTVTKIQCTATTGPCVSGNTANWNAPVRYRVTVSNPTSGTLTNVPLNDGIYKTTGTPTFTATVAATDPHCVSGCTVLTPPTTTVLPPTVNYDYTFFQLWAATLPSLSPSPAPPAVIDYIVTYAPVCETDAQPDAIINRITGGGSWADFATNMTPEADLCNLTVDKTKLTPGPIVFEQPTSYKVVFTNSSAASLAVTVRDALSISSSQYGNFDFNYSTSCTATSGTITPLPVPKNNVLATATYKQFAWQGLRLIDEHPTFGPMSTLTCQVTITAHKPPDTSPSCQGAGNPQLVNAAYMDLSGNYNPNAQPTLYDSEAADLPLCRNVIVTKTATPHNYGPGATAVYTITVENKGNNPVSSLTLKDVVQPPLIPVSVSACNQTAACTSGPILNTTTAPPQVEVSYGLLQPNQPVSFNLTVTVPQAGGSYPNLAVGSFLPAPGKDFYFKGDEEHFLQQEENIQVLTPTLAKSYDPSQIAPNATSTLVFNITNTNSDPKQTGISFSDTLPAGLKIVSVNANSCGGNATISNGGSTIALTGGQLVGPKADGSGTHTCQIIVEVKSTGECGVYPNDKSNFSNVVNVDVSNINQHLDVVGCSTPPPPTTNSCEVKTKDIACKADGTGGYLYTFTVTNNTGLPVTNLLVTPPSNSNFSITPQMPPLPNGVLPNGQSATLTVTITGGKPGQKVCFTVTLMTKDGPCCTVEVCTALPDCCATAIEGKLKCDQNGSYTYLLSIVNTSPNTVKHIYLYPPTGVTMTPSYFSVSLSPGATFQMPVTITGAKPGKLCFRISLHTEGMKECCSIEQCISLPECSGHGDNPNLTLQEPVGKARGDKSSP
jgi:uncharacterized repeat protein (TIGR01451 family)